MVRNYVCPLLPPRPSIGGGYTIFYYADLAAAVRWYEEVIGLERLLYLKGVVIFRISGSSYLALVADGAGSQRATSGRDKPVILSLQTEDLEAWHARLFALGVEGANMGNKVGTDGTMIEFKVYDPGGYTVEFFEWIF